MINIKKTLTQIGPDAMVDLRVQKAADFDSKDDLRKTRILDVTDSYIVLEQPTQKVHPEKVGSSMGISYITRDERGNSVRKILEAELVKVGDFNLKNDLIEALFFGYPCKVYSESVRRHFRVDVPLDEDAFVAITDLDGRPIGVRNRYRIMDLSLQGLKFLCEIKTTNGLTTDPVSRLSISDKILTRILVRQQELLWTKSIIKTRLVPKTQEDDVLYFSVEFIQGVTSDYQGKKIQFHAFTEQDRRCINPYINELQRKNIQAKRR
jgi:hypothetical protein